MIVGGYIFKHVETSKSILVDTHSDLCQWLTPYLLSQHNSGTHFMSQSATYMFISLAPCVGCHPTFPTM